MSQPTNTFDSYDAKGNREDLQDKIYMVSPEKTPVVSAIGRYTAKTPCTNGSATAWHRRTKTTR